MAITTMMNKIIYFDFVCLFKLDEIVISNHISVHDRYLSSNISYINMELYYIGIHIKLHQPYFFIK